MLIVPLAVGAGVTLGYLFEGRLRALGHLRFRAFALLAVALAMQVTLPLVPRGWQSRLVLLSYSLIGCWFLSNIPRRAFAVRCGLLAVAAGWFLNLLPITVNGAMPVSSGAFREISLDREAESGLGMRKHVLAGRDTRLAWLGDVIPVVPLRSVVSIGDLVMGAGLASTVASAMAGRGRGPLDDLRPSSVVSRLGHPRTALR